MNCSRPRDFPDGAKGCRRTFVAGPRMGADGPALPRADVAAGRPGVPASGPCRRPGPGRSDVFGRRWLCAADAEARRGRRFQRQHRRLDHRDPLQASGGRFRRQAGGSGSRLCRLGAPRSRRHGDQAFTRKTCDRQYHDGRRAHLRRLPARQLDRSAAVAARRCHSRTVRAGAAGRARAAGAARGQCRQEETAGSRPRLGAADLRALRVRDARWRQRVVGAQRPEADAAVQQRAELRPRRRQGGGAAECRLDHPAQRCGYFRGRYRADRRSGRSLVPRGKELHRRRGVPAGGKARRQTGNGGRARPGCWACPGCRACPRRQTRSGAGQAGGAASPRSAGQGDDAASARADGAGNVGGDRRAGQYRNQARPAPKREGGARDRARRARH